MSSKRNILLAIIRVLYDLTTISLALPALNRNIPPLSIFLFIGAKYVHGDMLSGNQDAGWQEIASMTLYSLTILLDR